MITDTNTSKGETFKWVAIGVIGITALTLAYFGIIKPLLNTFGITESAEDKEALKMLNKARESGFWKPTYYEGKTSKLSFVNKATDANNLAEEIEDAWGVVNDDEESIINAFSKIKNKVDLSYVAYHYQKNTGSDLLTDIDGKLSSAEKIQVFTITEKLNK